MLLRVLASLCILVHCTVPQCMAFCLAHVPGGAACCAAGAKSAAPACVPPADAETESCCGAARACCDAAPVERSAPRCGLPADAPAGQPCSSSRDCTSCAELCVCDAPKPPVERSSPSSQALIDALMSALSIATLDLPLVHDSAARAEAFACAAFTSESPPERLSRLSIWLC